MIVGIDIGTQSLKVVVTGNDLDILGTASSAYEPVFPHPGWAEQDPELWVSALKPVIAAALADAGADASDICAVGIGGQLDGCVPVGPDGSHSHPCLIWMDRRAERQVEGLPGVDILRRTGVNLDASHMAAKIRWLKDEEPGAVAGAVFHLPVSYLVWRLTGRAVIDHAHASTTMLYSLAKRGFDPELLELFGIDEADLPDVADSADAAGPLSADGAELTGLPAGITVAVGTGDDFSSALGAGLIEPGELTCVLGTAEVVGALHPEPVIDSHGLVETHAYAGGSWFIENPGWVSGGGLAWFLDTFNIANFAELDRMAESAGIGAGGVTFIPALSGAMAPEWDASARGCFYGLTLAHGTPHMARALLEGMAFCMRDVIERLSEMSVEISSIRLLGGGANSRVWAQIRADMTGLPVTIPVIRDTSPLGGAMLGAVAAGFQPDLRTAAARLGAIDSIITPNPAAKEDYDRAYRRYRKLYAALKPVFAEE
jgi:xylulokinase